MIDNSEPTLQSCPICGNKNVKITWLAGIAESLRKMMPDCETKRISNEVNGSPCWYICCRKCNFAIANIVKYRTYEEQQKKKREIVNVWNVELRVKK